MRRTIGWTLTLTALGAALVILAPCTQAIAPAAGPAAQPAAAAGPCAGLKPGDFERTVSHQGRDREYVLHVPPAYGSSKRLPLVIVLHGGGGSGPGIKELSRMDPPADEHGFMAAYPTGTKGGARGNSWNGGDCCGTAMEQNVDDLGFMAKLIDGLVEGGCVDPKRVYATGISNGAIMSHHLACDLADRIAAIAPIAGALMDASCSPSRPVPVIVFHGTADREVKPEGNFNRLSHPRRAFPPLAETVATWRRIDGCAAEKKTVLQNRKARCEEYQGCRDDADVVQCMIEGGGHTWPGGKPIMPLLLGPTSKDISASAEALKFFAAHPMQ